MDHDIITLAHTATRHISTATPLGTDPGSHLDVCALVGSFFANRYRRTGAGAIHRGCRPRLARDTRTRRTTCVSADGDTGGRSIVRHVHRSPSKRRSREAHVGSTYQPGSAPELSRC